MQSMITKIKNNLMVVAFLVVTAMASAPLAPASVHAQPASGGGECGGASILMLPPWYKGLCEGDGTIKSPGEVGLSKFIWTIALNIIEMALYIIGYVSLAFVIWGGFKYIISGDDANGVAGAKKTILNALIGLVLSIMSVGIVNVITGVV